MAERKVSQWAEKEAEKRGIDIGIVPADEDGKVGKQQVVDFAEQAAPVEIETPVEPVEEAEPTEPEKTDEQKAVERHDEALKSMQDAEKALEGAKQEYAQAAADMGKFRRKLTLAEIHEITRQNKARKLGQIN